MSNNWRPPMPESTNKQENKQENKQANKKTYEVIKYAIGVKEEPNGASIGYLPPGTKFEGAEDGDYIKTNDGTYVLKQGVIEV